MINPQLPPLIMDLLANNGPMTSDQICDAIEAVYQTDDNEVYNALNWMDLSEGMLNCNWPIYSIRESWTSDRPAFENTSNWKGGEE